MWLKKEKEIISSTDENTMKMKSPSYWTSSFLSAYLGLLYTFSIIHIIGTYMYIYVCVYTCIYNF